MMNRLSLSLLIATLTLTACGPTAEDETKMKEKMALESARAKIMLEGTDCAALETSLVEFKTTNADKLKSLDTWWVGLGDGAKDKLIEANRAEWDSQSAAMIAASACPDALENGI